MIDFRLDQQFPVLVPNGTYLATQSHKNRFSDRLLMPLPNGPNYSRPLKTLPLAVAIAAQCPLGGYWTLRDACKARRRFCCTKRSYYSLALNTAGFQLSAILDETRLRRSLKDSSGQEQELAPAIVTSSAQVISPSNYREPHQRTAES